MTDKAKRFYQALLGKREEPDAAHRLPFVKQHVAALRADADEHEARGVTGHAADLRRQADALEAESREALEQGR